MTIEFITKEINGPFIIAMAMAMGEEGIEINKRTSNIKRNWRKSKQTLKNELSFHPRLMRLA